MASSRTRDWAGLPYDILWSVLSRLPHTDILRGTELVCKPWRRVSVDEPLLWRRIDVSSIEDRHSYDSDEELEVEEATDGQLQMARAAVDRSDGQCEFFSGPADSEFLAYLADRAPLLRTLVVTSELELPDPEAFVDRVATRLLLLEGVVLTGGIPTSQISCAFMDNCPSIKFL